MPKFTFEVDTETKTATFMVDGKEMDVSDAHMCKYVSYWTGAPESCVSVSYSEKDHKTGDSTSHNISFDKCGVTESETNYSMAKDMHKAISALHASARLSKELSKLKNK